MAYSTHHHILPYLMSGNNFVSILASHFVSFANSCFSSLNNKISFIACNACISPQRHIFDNLYFVHYLFHNQHNLFHPTGNAVCELLLVRSIGWGYMYTTFCLWTWGSKCVLNRGVYGWVFVHRIYSLYIFLLMHSCLLKKDE